jgi:hypothetical protein
LPVELLNLGQIFQVYATSTSPFMEIKTWVQDFTLLPLEPNLMSI